MKWIASLFRGRGLYWALSLCIVIAAACSFFAVKNIVEQNKPQTDQGGEAVWDLPKAPVEQDVEDVPIKATPAPTATPRPSASARRRSSSTIKMRISPVLSAFFSIIKERTEICLKCIISGAANKRIYRVLTISRGPFSE